MAPQVLPPLSLSLASESSLFQGGFPGGRPSSQRPRGCDGSSSPGPCSHSACCTRHLFLFHSFRKCVFLLSPLQASGQVWGMKRMSKMDRILFSRSCPSLVQVLQPFPPHGCGPTDVPARSPLVTSPPNCPLFSVGKGTLPGEIIFSPLLPRSDLITCSHNAWNVLVISHLYLNHYLLDVSSLLSRKLHASGVLIS